MSSTDGPAGFEPVSAASCPRGPACRLRAGLSWTRVTKSCQREPGPSLSLCESGPRLSEWGFGAGRRNISIDEGKHKNLCAIGYSLLDLASSHTLGPSPTSSSVPPAMATAGSYAGKSGLVLFIK
jgi:hypothetical protein